MDRTVVVGKDSPLFHAQNFYVCVAENFLPNGWVSPDDRSSVIKTGGQRIRKVWVLACSGLAAGFPVNAPLALFVYARLDHTRRTVQALLNNPESAGTDLFIFSDAARSPENSHDVQRVREYITGIKGFRSLTIHTRSENVGLARSIIDGVSTMLANHETVIVLEDDMETSPNFLRYMNEALDRYAEDQRVVSVHGYVYPTQGRLPEAFFLRGADCWGWGTWRRGWAYFSSDGRALLDQLKRRKLQRAFDFNGSYNYSGMLRAQIKGENDSWAVLWYASAFLANKLTLYPGRSLVRNIGNDSSGTHVDTVTAFDVELSDTWRPSVDAAVEESTFAKTEIEQFFWATRPTHYRLLRRLLPTGILHQLSLLAQDWLSTASLRWLARLLKRR